LSEESQKAIIDFLSEQNCLDDTRLISHVIAPRSPSVQVSNTMPPQISQTATSVIPTRRHISSPFKLRSKAVNSHCLTAEDSLVLMNHCDDSESQLWGYNRDLGHLRNIGSGRCLMPSSSDRSSNKIRLTMHPCPFEDDEFHRWRFSAGLIRNVGIASSGTGADLVLEAACAIKRFHGNEELVLIPILSNIEESKTDFQTWDRIFG
jgi:hypothetical protein